MREDCHSLQSAHSEDPTFRPIGSSPTSAFNRVGAPAQAVLMKTRARTPATVAPEKLSLTQVYITSAQTSCSPSAPAHSEPALSSPSIFAPVPPSAPRAHAPAPAAARRTKELQLSAITDNTRSATGSPSVPCPTPLLGHARGSVSSPALLPAPAEPARTNPGSPSALQSTRNSPAPASPRLTRLPMPASRLSRPRPAAPTAAPGLNEHSEAASAAPHPAITPGIEVPHLHSGPTKGRNASPVLATAAAAGNDARRPPHPASTAGKELLPATQLKATRSPALSAAQPAPLPEPLPHPQATAVAANPKGSPLVNDGSSRNSPPDSKRSDGSGTVGTAMEAGEPTPTVRKAGRGERRAARAERRVAKVLNAPTGRDAGSDHPEAAVASDSTIVRRRHDSSMPANGRGGEDHGDSGAAGGAANLSEELQKEILDFMVCNTVMLFLSAQNRACALALHFFPVRQTTPLCDIP